MLINLAINNKTEEVNTILNSLEPPFKRNILIDIIEALHSKGPVENVPLYMDEFFKCSNELQTKYGMKIFKDLTMVGTNPMYDIAESALKDQPAFFKTRAHLNFMRGIIFNSNYYLATQKIPEQISRARELQLYNEIISHSIQKKISENKMENKGWEEFETDSSANKGEDYEGLSGEDFIFDSLD